MSIKDKGLQYWLPSYLWQQLQPKKKVKSSEVIHLFVCVVDHFEPFHGNVSFEKAKKRVETWNRDYPLMAQKHCDCDGVYPQHTWFYPPHLDHCFLEDLVQLCRNDFGDIEMHLHHNHMKPFPDTSETLRKKILDCIRDYSKYNIFCLPDGSKTFGFIHGDWSLDNACGDEICGVNDEITILKECGCYADFTFPSLGKAQPVMINKIYYANDDPEKSKSYSWGHELKYKGRSNGDLLMIPGIIGLRWKSRLRRFIPSIEASNIDLSDAPTPSRIDYWVDNAISIKGFPNWKFIKLHTHGANETTWDGLLYEKADKMFSYFEEAYNDNVNYSLHYVTARELFNIIKAVEAGEVGESPNSYRNFLIPKYCL